MVFCKVNSKEQKKGPSHLANSLWCRWREPNRVIQRTVPVLQKKIISLRDNKVQYQSGNNSCQTKQQISEPLFRRYDHRFLMIIIGDPFFVSRYYSRADRNQNQCKPPANNQNRTHTQSKMKNQAGLIYAFFRVVCLFPVE